MGRKFSAEQATNTVTTLGAGTKFVVLTTTPANKFITSENVVADTIFTTAFQAKDAGLTSIAGLTTAADKMVYTTASDVYAVADLSVFARTILDDANATAVRTTLGVDASGTDNSTNVSLGGTLDYITLVGQVLTRNAIDLTTDTTGTLAATSGGTGLTSTSTLLNSNVTPTTLGLVIGTNVQAYDATYLVDADIGVNVQAYDAGLQALADLADGSGVLTNNGTGGFSWASAGGGGDALVANPLSQFAATTSAQLLGVISDETGTGLLVFATGPTFASIANTGVVSAGTWQGGVIDATYGGTGLSSISTLLNSNVTPTTLGLVIGTNVQAYDSTYLVDADIGVNVQAYDATIVVDADIGITVQAYDATLASIALLGTAANKFAYTTGIDTWAEGSVTAFGLTILDDADANAVRSTIGVDASGTDNSDNNAANTLYASDYRAANFVSGTDYEPAKGGDDNFVTDAEKVVIGNTSGTNTGDQAIPTSGVDFDPVGTDNSDNNAANTTYASDYRAANFVSGTDYAPALGADDNYVTDVEKVVIGNTSGTNSGDQAIPASGVDFDSVGTDNSTNVSLAGTPDYLTLVGQVLTRNAVDLSTDVTGALATGTVPWSQVTSAPTFATLEEVLVYSIIF
tara:strand:+ start:2366 stop:4258 length:1893 start_codon:yes stop_codon:yes gene_type:complete